MTVIMLKSQIELLQNAIEQNKFCQLQTNFVCVNQN